MTFDPNQHLIQLKSKNGPQDYLPVQFRLVWFREACPEGTIETELVRLDLDRETFADAYEWNEQTRKKESYRKRALGFAMFKATVRDSKGGSAVAHGSEGAADFGDYVEKAETKAIGRALAMLGFGTQFAPDLNEEHRIVDAPVDTAPSVSEPKQQNVQPVGSDSAPKVKQLEDLRILCRHLGKQITRPKTYAEAEKLLHELTTEYNEMIAKGRASSGTLSPSGDGLA